MRKSSVSANESRRASLWPDLLEKVLKIPCTSCPEIRLCLESPDKLARCSKLTTYLEDC